MIKSNFIRSLRSWSRLLSALLIADTVLGTLVWLFVHPFSVNAQQELLTDSLTLPVPLKSAQVGSFYNESFFYLNVAVWVIGLVILLLLFCDDLVLSVDPIEYMGNRDSGRVVSIESSRDFSTGMPHLHLASKWSILRIPFELSLRFAIFLFLYYLGIRAVDVDGMISGGSTLVRFDTVASFSRGAEYLLISFFNNVSLVGEFATFRIRCGFDVAFTVLNIIARFFAVFLTVNVVFLRLNVMASYQQAARLRKAS